MAPTATSLPEAISDGSARARTPAQGLEMGARLCRPCCARSRSCNGCQGGDGLPETHRQVSFLELALDFESHAGKPLPPTP